MVNNSITNPGLSLFIAGKLQYNLCIAIKGEE